MIAFEITISSNLIYPPFSQYPRVESFKSLFYWQHFHQTTAFIGRRDGFPAFFPKASQ